MDTSRWGGYYTVEAVFVVTICLWILMSLCYTGLYVHDRLLLASEINEETAVWIAGGQKKCGEWEKEVKKRIQKKMFLFRISGVEAVKKKTKVCVLVKSVLPVSQPLWKRILTGNRNELFHQTERETLSGAEYRWNADALKDEKEVNSQ